MFRKRPEEVPRRVKCMPKTKLETLKKEKPKNRIKKEKFFNLLCRREARNWRREREEDRTRNTHTDKINARRDYLSGIISNFINHLTMDK